MPIPTLIVILGPTGVGKTDISLHIAQQLNTEIVSCDSRQLYREMRIGTAIPTPEQLTAIPHHFIASHSIHDPYTAGQYELEAMSLLQKLFTKYSVIILSGGSGLYIDALCHGIDDFPSVDPAVRKKLIERYEKEGLDILQQELKILDKESYTAIDLQNPRRVIRALEVSLNAGQPYSSFKRRSGKKRPFRIIKIGLQRPRVELYERINRRTLQMMDEGWLEEARNLYPFRHLPALRTVGYKELFDCIDGTAGLDKTIQLIQQHTRNYAKKQCTYWRRDKDILWLDATDPKKILTLSSKFNQ